MHALRFWLPVSAALVFGIAVNANAAPARGFHSSPLAHSRFMVPNQNCPAVAGGTGTLTDGDFSGAADPGGGLPTFGRGSAFAPDWVVTKRTIDLYGSTAWPNLDGLCSVDLDGTPGRGGIKHAAFATNPGTAYNVTFVFSGNGACGPTVKTLKIKATGGQTTQMTWDVSNGNDAQHGAFTIPSWQFTAKTTATILSFTSLDTGHGNCGPVVTAISVNPASGARKR